VRIAIVTAVLAVTATATWTWLRVPAETATAAQAARGRMSTPSDRAESDKVDVYVAAEMAARHIPGASIAVVRAGAVVHARSFGQANLELSAPVTADSVFKLASLTKPFTAIAILMLVRDGSIALDQRLAEYLPNLPAQWAGVTVRQLLSHTSGVTDYLRAPRWSWQTSWRQEFTLDEFVRFAAEAPPAFPPGEGIAYSNTGFYLLGMLIEKVTGRPYGEAMAERIFRPLQMTATRRDTPSTVVPNRASGYLFTGHPFQNAEYTSATWAYAEGGLLSTAADLAKWDIALSAGALLDRPTLDLMWTPTTLRNGEKAVIGDNGAGKPNYYGLGWYISEHRGHRIVLHPGTKPGFSSALTRFLDEPLTVIVLCNTSSGSPAFPLSLGIADVYLAAAGRSPR
jgi:CubicO group peptidase (beta-lactamase class C family)